MSWVKKSLTLFIFIILPTVMFWQQKKSLNLQLQQLQHIGWLIQGQNITYFLWFHTISKEFKVSPIHASVSLYKLNLSSIKHGQEVECLNEIHTVMLKK